MRPSIVSSWGTTTLCMHDYRWDRSIVGQYLRRSALVTVHSNLIAADTLYRRPTLEIHPTHEAEPDRRDEFPCPD